jgi:hypothetical protein
MTNQEISEQLKVIDWLLLERVASIAFANDVPAPKLVNHGLIEKVSLPHPVEDRKIERWKITDLGRDILKAHNPNFSFAKQS